jgi:hypothetical protein
MALLDQIRSGTYVADETLLVVPGRLISLAQVAERIAEGEPTLHAVRDFLDQAGHAEPQALAPLLDEEPKLLDDRRADALLAGIAEYLAVTRGFRCPSWTQQPERFLDCFWFVSKVGGFRAVAIAQTPVSLKRRGIFWPERSLQRV